jgi:hypothetical protein
LTRRRAERTLCCPAAKEVVEGNPEVGYLLFLHLPQVLTVCLSLNTDVKTVKVQKKEKI